MKKIFAGFMALLMGVFTAGCHSQNTNESEIETDTEKHTVASETAHSTETQNTDSIPDSGISSESNADTQNNTSVKTEPKSTETADTDIQITTNEKNSAPEETYIYDDNGNVDIDAIQNDVETPSASPADDVKDTEFESQSDDDGNIVV